MQCSQDVLKQVEEQETGSEPVQVPSIDVTSSACEAVSTVQSHTNVDPRYVQLLGDKAAVCFNILMLPAIITFLII